MKPYAFLLIIPALAGCIDEPDFSSVPRIYYNSIAQSTELDGNGKKIRENVTVTINFEDGNGDLGASAEERSNPVFNQKYGKWGNYELITAIKEPDGQWTEKIMPGDTTNWMPVLKSRQLKGPIKGKLDFNSKWPYGNTSVPLEVKFKIRIRDRALNVSNQIETDIVTVPGYR